jgi:hypothetical protein
MRQDRALQAKRCGFQRQEHLFFLPGHERRVLRGQAFVATALLLTVPPVSVKQKLVFLSPFSGFSTASPKRTYWRGGPDNKERFR